MHRELIEFWKTAPDDPFAVLFEHAPVLMHSIDSSGKLIQVSRFWADLLGYDRDEMIGRPSTDFLSPDSQIKARERILPEYLRKGKIHDVEYDFIAKSGEPIAVRLSATTVLDDDGNVQRSLKRFDINLRHIRRP
ncbi:MAG: PAS domain S-box protein [Rhodobacteraceae bacterium]|nr:PAS domain S-box protein [Paracoccaceae bacterium]